MGLGLKRGEYVKNGNASLVYGPEFTCILQTKS